MYKERKRKVRPVCLLLLSIGISAALLAGCGKEAAPVDAPVAEKNVENSADAERERELSELAAG